jgi:hypothetical protein
MVPVAWGVVKVPDDAGSFDPPNSLSPQSYLTIYRDISRLSRKYDDESVHGPTARCSSFMQGGSSNGVPAAVIV